MQSNLNNLAAKGSSGTTTQHVPLDADEARQ